MFSDEFAQGPAVGGNQGGDFFARVGTGVDSHNKPMPSFFHGVAQNAADLGEGAHGSGDLIDGGSGLELDGSGGAQTLLQDFGRIGRLDFAMINDDHAPAGGLDLGEDVSAEQDGMFFAEVADEFTNLADLIRVEAVGGFVEDEELWAVDEGIGQSDALAVSFGQGGDHFFPHVGQAAQVHDFTDALAAVAAAQSFEASAEVEVFLDAKVIVQRDIFRHVTDFAPRFEGVGEDVVTGHSDPAGGGGQVAGQDAHGGAFACAIGSEEPDDFPPADRKRDIIHGGAAGIAFGQVFDLNHTR